MAFICSDHPYLGHGRTEYSTVVTSMSIVNLSVYVVDHEHASEEPIKLSFSPNTIFLQLKQQVSIDWLINEDLQIWIFKDTVCLDEETLIKGNLIVDIPCNIIYLYLLSEDELQLKKAGTLEIYLTNSFGDKRLVNFISQSLVWECPVCTYKNDPTIMRCDMCKADRPKNFKVPKDYVMTEHEKEIENAETERLIDVEKRFAEHVRAEEELYMPNPEEFECCICFADILAGQGVILRECAHNICKDCLINYIAHLDNPDAPCPETGCEAQLQEREIRGVAPLEDYERYTQLCHRIAEACATNSFHCKTPDCRSWVVYEDEVNFFKCDICNKTNCLTCNAIHDGQTCKEYQDDLKVKSENDDAAKKDIEALELMITNGEAMKCPGCQIFVMKKSGCDWMQCSMCRVEICWATKGPRWGPKGNGDTSGGCGCDPPRKKCTPTCGNCH